MLFASSSSSASTAPRSSATDSNPLASFSSPSSMVPSACATLGSARSPRLNLTMALFSSLISMRKASWPCGESMAYISAFGKFCASSV